MSLRTRLLAAFAYGYLLILVALMVPLALNLARRVDAEVRNDAAGQAHIVAAQAAGSMGNRAQLRRLARSAASDLGARVIVVDSSGLMRADSAGGAARSFSTRPEIRTALGGRTAQGERHSDTLGEDLLFTTVPVTNGGQIVGAVRVTQSVGAVNDRVRRSVLALVGDRSRGARDRARARVVPGRLALASAAPARRTRRDAWRKATSTRAPRSKARPSSARSPSPSTT